MDSTITAIIQWLAPILSTVIIAAATASINMQVSKAQRSADERHEETERKRKAEAEWRDEIAERISVIEDRLTLSTEAQQTTMRATLVHNFEKYYERGWLTPEERASWCDMHDKYSAMGFNGLIDTYRMKLDGLPDREI